MSRKRIRSAPRSRPSVMQIALRDQSCAPRPRSCASSSTCSGSCHVRERRRLVATEDQEELVVGRLARAAARSVSAVYEGPSRSISIRDTRSRSSSAIASSHHLEARLGARVVLELPVRRPGPPAITTSRSSSSCAHASCAQTRWPMCGGLNAPPRMPTRKRLLADLAGAFDHELVGGQLAQRRSARARAASGSSCRSRRPCRRPPPSVKRVDALT